MDLIYEIETSIYNNHKVCTSMGVSKGLAGVSLFYYYLSKIDKKYDDHVFYFLNKSIEGLNEEYSGNDIISDIIEIGQLMLFYEKKKILEYSEINFYFENFNSIIKDSLNETIANKNISLKGGAINFGYFFLQQQVENQKISEILDLIILMSENHDESNGVFWRSNIKRNSNYYVELSGYNGLVSILDFLLTLINEEIEIERASCLAKKCLNYILFHKLSGGENLFPFETTSKEPDENHNLAYGDLSIGRIFYLSGKLFNNSEYLKLSEKIFLNSSRFRDDKDLIIKDANLLYGSAGISSIYRAINSELKTQELEKAINYWDNKTLYFKKYNNDWAGFEAYFNQFDINTQISFTDGVIGIGIYLIAKKLNFDFDYLKFLNFNI